MIEVTSFLLKHLYEFMADNYAVDAPQEEQRLRADDQQPPAEICSIFSYFSALTTRRQAQTQRQQPADPDQSEQTEADEFGANLRCSARRESSANEREQETNQQIVSFLTYNQLPDLACDTFIELLFICVFLSMSWIFVMIVQLHCYQSTATPTTTMPVINGHTEQQHHHQNHRDNMDQQQQQQQQHQKATSNVPHHNKAVATHYYSARHFYCNTKYINSLMYCNNKEARQVAF